MDQRIRMLVMISKKGVVQRGSASHGERAESALESNPLSLGDSLPIPEGPGCDIYTRVPPIRPNPAAALCVPAMISALHAEQSLWAVCPLSRRSVEVVGSRVGPRHWIPLPVWLPVAELTSPGAAARRPEAQIVPWIFPGTIRDSRQLHMVGSDRAVALQSLRIGCS